MRESGNFVSILYLVLLRSARIINEFAELQTIPFPVFNLPWRMGRTIALLAYWCAVCEYFTLEMYYLLNYVKF